MIFDDMGRLERSAYFQSRHSVWARSTRSRNLTRPQFVLHKVVLVQSWLPARLVWVHFMANKKSSHKKQQPHQRQQQPRKEDHHGQLLDFVFSVPARALIFTGLDDAGKTSILYRLKLGEVVTTIPTIGFNVEGLDSSWTNGIVVTSWDVGGRDKTRPLWRNYFANTDCIVFVVDSTDRDRLEQAKDLLYEFLNEEELRGLPLLVFCDKQDLPNALTPAEILHHFFGGKGDTNNEKVADDENHTSAAAHPLAPIHVVDRPLWALRCSVIDGTGLKEGMKWLTAQAMATKTKKNTTEAKTQALKTSAAAAAAQRKHDSRRAVASTTTTKPTMSSWMVNDNVLGYSLSDGRTNPVLQNFRPIQLGSQCPFAKAAKLWGAKLEVVGEDDAAAAAAAVAEALAEFVRRSDKNEQLDGFCLDLGDEAAALSTDPSIFGTHVRAVLRALSDRDPSGERVMRATYIGERGWRFRFARADFFVTTFSPCYPSTSSRYAFGTGRAFVLLQPERSFLRHDLPTDTPLTQDPPQTIRDKTRLAFRDAGRAYHIPSTTKYPPAEHIVKPLNDDGWTVIRWWENKEDNSLNRPPDGETKEAE
jgi:small GTP-binding protein